MAEAVEYELSLKDLFTQKLEGIKEASESFEKVLDKIKGHAKNLGLDTSFMEPLQFINEGIEKVNQLDEAHENLEYAIKSAGNFSEQAFDQMVAGAAEFSKHVKYNENDIVDMQTQLSKIGNVGEDQMKRLTEAGADVATKLHISLADAGKQLTDAMANPKQANALGTSLRIDPEVMKDIQDLATKGKTAEAQMKLLDAVQGQVGGSAKKAFESDPIAQFNKVVGDVQTQFSQAAIGILQALQPVLDMLKVGTKLIQGMAKWFSEHERAAKALGLIIATVAGAIAGYMIVAKLAQVQDIVSATWTKLVTGYEAARAEGLGILTGAQEALNLAMELNPIGLIVAGLVAVGAAIFYAYEKSETFHAGLWYLWGGIKAFVGLAKDGFEGLYHVIHGALTLNPEEFVSGLSKVEDTVHNFKKRIADGANKGYADGLADFYPKKDESVITAKTDDKKTTTIDNNNTVVPPPSKASGTKSITINIAINKQIETLNIKTSNLTETASSIQEKVAIALSNAVNQSQVTAGGR